MVGGGTQRCSAWKCCRAFTKLSRGWEYYSYLSPRHGFEMHLKYSNALQYKSGCHLYCGSTEIIFFEEKGMFGLIHKATFLEISNTMNSNEKCYCFEMQHPCQIPAVCPTVTNVQGRLYVRVTTHTTARLVVLWGSLKHVDVSRKLCFTAGTNDYFHYFLNHSFSLWNVNIKMHFIILIKILDFGMEKTKLINLLSYIKKTSSKCKDLLLVFCNQINYWNYY